LNENELNYTECLYLAGSDFTIPPSNITGISKWKYNKQTNICTLQFKVDTQIQKNVHMYIKITNMYQNHKLYIKSLDPDQLKGKMYEDARDIGSSGTTKCDFLQFGNCQTAAGFTFNQDLSYDKYNPDCLESPRDPVISNAHVDSQYYPCGLIANSMFSDTISPLRCISGNTPCRIPDVEFTQTGIAWPEDKGLYNKTLWATSTKADQIPKMLIPPPAWRKAWPDLYGKGYTASNVPDLASWERFQVWMRKAGLPTFRKFWGQNTTESVDVGIWEVDVQDTWDCRRFEGSKSLIFAETGIIGPRNPFLSILFLIVGIGSLLVTVLLVAVNPR
ncbi:CDC50/LEM3 family, partial [Globomyces pollinis-pini]